MDDFLFLSLFQVFTLRRKFSGRWMPWKEDAITWFRSAFLVCYMRIWISRYIYKDKARTSHHLIFTISLFTLSQTKGPSRYVRLQSIFSLGWRIGNSKVVKFPNRLCFESLSGLKANIGHPIKSYLRLSHFLNSLNQCFNSGSRF